MVAEQIEKKLLLERFYKETSRVLEGHSYLFSNENDFFQYITRKAEFERLVFIIDEFQYYNKIDPSITSVLQRYIDKEWKKTQLMLILCGSEIRMMEELFGLENPLHGRRTGQWKVLPFGIEETVEYFPNRSIEDILQLRAVFGGIPTYLQFYNPDIALWESVKEEIMSKGHFLYEEPIHLLSQEFREIHRYWSILEAIAQKEWKVVHIANKTGIESRTLMKYLNNLLAIDLIKKIAPTNLNKVKTKNIQYRLADNYLDFWFRFISPFKSQLELANVEIPLENIHAKWSDYMGQKFEENCIEIFELLNRKGLLPIRVIKIGLWWNKNVELDITCISNSKQVVIIQCKWGKTVNGKMLLNKLINKIDETPWKNSKNLWIGIIGRGFKEELKGCITLTKVWSCFTNNENIEQFLVKL